MRRAKNNQILSRDEGVSPTFTTVRAMLKGKQ